MDSKPPPPPQKETIPDAFSMVDVMDVLKSIAAAKKEATTTAASPTTVRDCSACPLLANHSTEYVIDASQIIREQASGTPPLLFARGLTQSGRAVVSAERASDVTLHVLNAPHEGKSAQWRRALAWSGAQVLQCVVDAHSEWCVVIARRDNTNETLIALVDVESATQHVLVGEFPLTATASLAFRMPHLYAIDSTTQQSVLYEVMIVTAAAQSNNDDAAPQYQPLGVRTLQCIGEPLKSDPLRELFIGTWPDDHDVPVPILIGSTDTAVPHILQVIHSSATHHVVMSCGRMTQLAHEMKTEVVRFVADGYTYKTAHNEPTPHTHVDNGVAARWGAHNAWLWDSASETPVVIRDHANLWCVCVGAQHMVALYRKQGDIMLLDRRSHLEFARSIIPIARPAPLTNAAEAPALPTERCACVACTHTRRVGNITRPSMRLLDNERTLVLLDESCNVRVLQV